MRYRNLVQSVLAAITLGVPITACGHSSPPAAKPFVLRSGSPVAQIKADWQEFFNSDGNPAEDTMLLQDGKAFAGMLKSLNGQFSSATVRLDKVTLVSSARANVTYAVVADGAILAPDQPGVVVRQNGIWKVGASSFCNLLSMQPSSTSSKLPAICRNFRVAAGLGGGLGAA